MFFKDLKREIDEIWILFDQHFLVFRGDHVALADGEPNTCCAGLNNTSTPSQCLFMLSGVHYACTITMTPIPCITHTILFPYLS